MDKIKRITIRLSTMHAEELRNAAKDRGITISELVRQAISAETVQRGRREKQTSSASQEAGI